MSIYETIDLLKAFFDKAAQRLSNKFHELAIWMVSDLGRTCPFVLSLMNITVAKSNSIYSSKMNVLRNYNKSKECLRIFNINGTLKQILGLKCALHLANLAKIFLLI
jgi:hypothetical protein